MRAASQGKQPHLHWALKVGYLCADGYGMSKSTERENTKRVLFGWSTENRKGNRGK